ncbi:helix-turn-helix transcriptional regulator [Deefgea piscis]|uniref:helix-turn-helix transcriptional regulator n=1 Tax=Deefgea piscis TaxID=2739061 RepID=UPI001C81D16A|nr:AlpA family phage regulatory protein [Deefgea piscis]QZA80131.1 AlpA family phage regulatory protein [Deefgea piscis]
MSAQINQPIRFIRLPELLKMVSMGRTTLYDKLDEKSKRYDATFPKPIKDGSRVMWIEHEVQAWIENLIHRSRAGC